MEYEYVVKCGGKFRIKPFTEPVELRKDHMDLLDGRVYFVDHNTLRIETGLSYDVGQNVSIGGFVSNVVNFRLLELSITDQPVFEDAQIISRKEIENGN